MNLKQSEAASKCGETARQRQAFLTPSQSVTVSPCPTRSTVDSLTFIALLGFCCVVIIPERRSPSLLYLYSRFSRSQEWPYSCSTLNNTSAVRQTMASAEDPAVRSSSGSGGRSSGGGSRSRQNVRAAKVMVAAKEIAYLQAAAPTATVHHREERHTPARGDQATT